jgi:hypothetical protein
MSFCHALLNNILTGLRFADRDMFMRFCGLGPGHRAFWDAFWMLRDMVRSAFGLVIEKVVGEGANANKMEVDGEEGEEGWEDEEEGNDDVDDNEDDEEQTTDGSDEESDEQDDEELGDDVITPEDNLGYAVL